MQPTEQTKGNRQTVLTSLSRSLAVLTVLISSTTCSGMQPATEVAPPPNAGTDIDQPITQPPQRGTEAKHQPNSATRLDFSDQERGRETIQDVNIAGGNSVNFSFGETTIDDFGISFLRQQAILLKENRHKIVTLEAFTENLGSRSLNLAIAEMLVNAVAEKLRQLGVPQTQIRRRSVARRKLSSSCNTQACRQQMRRVELHFN